VVERITNQREALPAFDAIYFITPESIDLVMQDFPSGPAAVPGKKQPASRAKYNNVHIFLTTGSRLLLCLPVLPLLFPANLSVLSARAPLALRTGLVPSLAAKIRQSPQLAQRVRTLTEIGLDFYGPAHLRPSAPRWSWLTPASKAVAMCC